MDVVCGVDLVDAAPSEVAAALASATGGSLHLVHAWQPVEPLALAGAGMPESAIPPAMMAEATRDTEIAIRERLSSRAALLAHGGLDVTWDVVVGPPAVRILEAAERRHAGLIVAGAPLRGAMRWILGSTVEPIVRRSPVPVLVTREPATLLAWLAGERPLRIVAGVAADGFDAIAGAIDMLRAIGPVETDIVHALAPHAESFDRVPFLAEGALEARTRAALLARVASRFPARLRILRERADRAITTIAARTGCGLVLVGTHGRRGLGAAIDRSISTAVLRTAPCSTLIAPLGTAAHAEPPVP